MSFACAADGIVVVNRFLDSTACEELLERISSYRRLKTVPAIYRPSANRDGRPLNYSVIDGDCIARDLPELLVLRDQVTHFLRENGNPQLAPLQDARVACNVNITPNGGTYRYHYDRNAVTAILYLNETDGGETECYPNYRLALSSRSYPRLQRRLDQLLQTRVLRSSFGRLTVVRPEAGKLLVMRGNRCLHSVRPVLGDRERVNVIMAYDYPGTQFDGADALNSYLYNATPNGSLTADPNYR
jgi:2OG-Fe(II) oxygenase superfamily